jgi:hypothetical protein
MKKSILTAVVVALAATSQAGSLAQSKDGSSKISSGALSMSANTIRVVVESASGASAQVGTSLLNSAKAVGNASVFVLENPSEASSKVVDASQASTLFVLDKSGQILELTIEGSKAFVTNPVESTSNASRASKNAAKRAIEVTIDASGRVMTASGQSLKNTYGEDVELVMDGASDIGTGASAAATSVATSTSNAAQKVYELGKGSVVAVYNGSVSTVKFIGETVVDSAATSVATSGNSSAAISAGDLYGAIMAVLLMPADAFAASAQTGYQNNLK